MNQQHGSVWVDQLRSESLTPDTKTSRCYYGIGEFEHELVENRLKLLVRVFIKDLENLSILPNRLVYVFTNFLSKLIKRLRSLIAWSFSEHRKDDDLGDNSFADPTPSPNVQLIAGLNLEKYRDYCMIDRTDEEARLVQYIGEQIRLLRMASNLTREELAYLLESDIESITAVENGYGDQEHALLLVCKLTQLEQKH